MYYSGSNLFDNDQIKKSSNCPKGDLINNINYKLGLFLRPGDFSKIFFLCFQVLYHYGKVEDVLDIPWDLEQVIEDHGAT